MHRVRIMRRECSTGEGDLRGDRKAAAATVDQRDPPTLIREVCPIGLMLPRLRRDPESADVGRGQRRASPSITKPPFASSPKPSTAGEPCAASLFFNRPYLSHERSL